MTFSILLVTLLVSTVIWSLLLHLNIGKKMHWNKGEKLYRFFFFTSTWHCVIRWSLPNDVSCSLVPLRIYSRQFLGKELQTTICRRKKSSPKIHYSKMDLELICNNTKFEFPLKSSQNLHNYFLICVRSECTVFFPISENPWKHLAPWTCQQIVPLDKLHFFSYTI